MKKVVFIIPIFTNYISLNSQNIKNPKELILNNVQNIQNIQKLNSSEHPIVKKIIYEYDNYEKNDWVILIEAYYEYDLAGNIHTIAENRYSHQFGDFRLFSLEEFYYNNNMLVEKIYITHRDWSPIEMFRILYYYNNSDSLTEQLFQGTQDSGATWQNQSRYVFGYDEKGNNTNFYFDVWENENWLTANEVESIFDSNGNLIEMVQKSCFQGECSNSDRYLYEYDEKNNNIKFTYQWMQENGWENYSQSIMEYDSNNNLTVDIFQHWNSEESIWYNEAKDDYTYDLSGNLVSQVHFRWDYYASNPDWIYSQRYSYTYQDGYKIQEIYEAYDEEWINQSKTVYYYEGITDVDENSNLHSKFELTQNYPNPFNPSTVIKYSISVVDANFASTTNVLLKVYDVLGKEVAILVNKTKQPGNHKVEFNASNLTSGVYFYRLKAGSFVETKKMVLLR